MNALIDKKEVIELILEGRKLLLAGSEEALSELPSGNWIAGTIPYFIAEEGGVFDKERVFVSEIPSFVNDIQIIEYTQESIQNVYNDAPEHGFSIIIIPAGSELHSSFALNAPNFENFASKILLGWIAGVDLDSLGQEVPKIANGNNNHFSSEKAIVLHASLPENKVADINIINIFHQGSGDSIQFPKDGFSIQDAIINGETVNFYDYLLQNEINIQYPLVANMCGAMVNISFQKLHEDTKTVDLYAPVFENVEYKIASSLGDYVQEFTKQLPHEGLDNFVFSCNCILNYLYAELEGKQTASCTGPITFGEIAYQLLNQTMAYLVIEDI